MRRNKHSIANRPISLLSELDDDLREYDLEHYDDDAAMGADDAAEDTENGDTMGIFGNIKSLVYHGSNEEDPYITLPENASDDDEREELQILGTDNLVLAARVEDEVAHLEVYVYEDGADNLYVHHDLMLPAIPLAVEWLDLPVNKKGADANSRGNFVAVGTMDPDIELWDLDLIDCMYPNAILGQGGQQQNGGEKPKKKKNKKSKKARDDYHVDAVLSLAANRQHRNLLASASADKTVKLWDLNTTQCAQSYSYHTDKVCSITWHPQESTALLSGSYDRSVIAADMRAPQAGSRKWMVDSDVENIKWDPHDPNFFYVSLTCHLQPSSCLHPPKVSTESGVLHYFDARVTPSSTSPATAVWRLQAHDDSISSFDVNPIIPGFLVTGSADKLVKLWNVSPSAGPSMVVSRDLDVGRVFSTTFGPDAEVGFRLAVAGSKGNLQIWDTSTNAAIRRAFAGRVAMPAEGEVGGGVEERLVGLALDDEEDSDEGEGDGEEDEGVDI